MTGIPEEILNSLQVVEYRLQSKLPGYIAGQHPGIFVGSNGRFSGYSNLLAHMDVRRIDPVATERAGSPVPLVRSYQMKVAATVFLLVDLSASMQFEDKIKQIAKIVAMIGYSAFRMGDRFGLIGYSDRVHLFYPPRHQLEWALHAATAIWNITPSGQHHGLDEACSLLPRRRGLLLWLSDFHVHFEPLALANLHFYEVAMVCLLRRAEFHPDVEIGWSELVDPELGITRGVFVRPAFRRRLIEQREVLKAKLQSISQRMNADLVILDTDDAGPLVDYLLTKRA